MEYMTELMFGIMPQSEGEKCWSHIHHQLNLNYLDSKNNFNFTQYPAFQIKGTSFLFIGLSQFTGINPDNIFEWNWRKHWDFKRLICFELYSISYAMQSQYGSDFKKPRSYHSRQSHLQANKSKMRWTK